MLFFWLLKSRENRAPQSERRKSQGSSTEWFLFFFFISYYHYAPPPHLETQTLIMFRLFYKKRDPSTFFLAL